MYKCFCQKGNLKLTLFAGVKEKIWASSLPKSIMKIKLNIKFEIVPK